MTLAQMIPLAINISIFLLVLAFGLDAERKDILYLFRHPTLFLRSILAMNVVMVAVAAAIAAVFDLPRAVEVALVALAISPVPPILPKKQEKAGGSESYAIGLLTGASIVAVILAPVSVTWVGQAFGFEIGVPAEKIASIVLISVILPLTLGIMIRRFAPAFAARIVRPTSLAATALLMIACLPAIINAWPAVWALFGDGVALVLVAFTLIGLAVGHMLGGPDPGDRAVLALATGTRHPGVAIAIAGITFPDEPAAVAVVLYHLIFGALVSIPYVRWRRGLAAAAPSQPRSEP